jgi:hypothetical protein
MAPQRVTRFAIRTHGATPGRAGSRIPAESPAGGLTMLRKGFVSATLASIAGVLLLAAPLSGRTADSDIFQRLKALQGEWVGLDEAGKPTSQVMSVFRVTSGGHAIREVMFPGSEHEMVNMYYRDGDTVQMTHFCAGGNQPRMMLMPTPQEGVVRLQFIDVTNLQTANDEHMHEGVMTWVSPDHLKVEWRAYKNGKYSDSTRFDMVRRK